MLAKLTRVQFLPLLTFLPFRFLPVTHDLIRDYKSSQITLLPFLLLFPSLSLSLYVSLSLSLSLSAALSLPKLAFSISLSLPLSLPLFSLPPYLCLPLPLCSLPLSLSLFLFISLFLSISLPPTRPHAHSNCLRDTATSDSVPPLHPPPSSPSPSPSSSSSSSPQGAERVAEGGPAANGAPRYAQPSLHRSLRSGEVRSGQVRGQVRSGQVRSGDGLATTAAQQDKLGEHRTIFFFLAAQSGSRITRPVVHHSSSQLLHSGAVHL